MLELNISFKLFFNTQLSYTEAKIANVSANFIYEVTKNLSIYSKFFIYMLVLKKYEYVDFIMPNKLNDKYSIKNLVKFTCKF